MQTKGHLRKTLERFNTEVITLKDRLKELKEVYPKGTASLDIIGSCLDWAGVQIEHAIRELEHIKGNRHE